MAWSRREKEREDLEKRRALPESVRLHEDLANAEKSRSEKPKGQRAFLQKYHHKGAFYTVSYLLFLLCLHAQRRWIPPLKDSDILKKHDYSAPTAGTITNMESLPEAMQVRDFGKMSRTKWTHLSKEVGLSRLADVRSKLTDVVWLSLKGHHRIRRWLGFFGEAPASWCPCPRSWVLPLWRPARKTQLSRARNRRWPDHLPRAKASEAWRLKHPTANL